MRTVVNYAAELKMPAQALLEQLRKAGIVKKDGAERLTDADVTKLLRYLVGQRSPPAKKKTLVKLKAKGDADGPNYVVIAAPQAKPPARDRVVQARPMRQVGAQFRRAVSIETPYVLPPRAPSVRPLPEKRVLTSEERRAVVSNMRDDLGPLGDGRNPCSCNGENEHCYKCDGKGWISQEDTKTENVKMPPVLRHFSAMTPTPLISIPWLGEIKPKKQQPKPKASVDKPQKATAAKSRQEKANERKSLNRTLRPTRAEAEAMGWFKNAPKAVKSSNAELFDVTLSRKGGVISIRPALGSGSKQPPSSPKKAKTASQKAKRAKAKPIKQSPTPRNTAFSDAFAEAQERLAQERNERSLDATKDYWRLRDNDGSFGSYPAHDDYDE